MVTKVRNWRQRFDPSVDFIFRRSTEWGGTKYEVGDVIPDDLKGNKKKLLLFWESRRIELARFDQPPGAMPRPPVAPELPDFVERHGTW